MFTFASYLGAVNTVLNAEIVISLFLNITSGDFFLSCARVQWSQPAH